MIYEAIINKKVQERNCNVNKITTNHRIPKSKSHSIHENNQLGISNSVLINKKYNLQGPKGPKVKALAYSHSEPENTDHTQAPYAEYTYFETHTKSQPVPGLELAVFQLQESPPVLLL